MITVTQLRAIQKLYPEVVSTIGDIAYDVNGNEVSYDPSIIQSHIDNNLYIINRANEYPPITDYLDGIVKGDEEQVNAYIAACQAVKNKYPKPE